MFCTLFNAFSLLSANIGNKFHYTLKRLKNKGGSEGIYSSLSLLLLLQLPLQLGFTWFSKEMYFSACSTPYTSCKRAIQKGWLLPFS